MLNSARFVVCDGEETKVYGFAREVQKKSLRTTNLDFSSTYSMFVL